MNEIVRLLDVGARGGIDSRWRPFYENIDVLAFEPDPEECASLNSKSFPYFFRIFLSFGPVYTRKVSSNSLPLK